MSSPNAAYLMSHGILDGTTGISGPAGISRPGRPRMPGRPGPGIRTGADPPRPHFHDRESFVASQRY